MVLDRSTPESFAAFEAAVRMRDRFMQQEVWERLGVPVKDAIEAVGSLVGNLVVGIRGASVITLIAAALVLAGALAGYFGGGVDHLLHPVHVRGEAGHHEFLGSLAEDPLQCGLDVCRRGRDFEHHPAPVGNLPQLRH